MIGVGGSTSIYLVEDEIRFIPDTLGSLVSTLNADNKYSISTVLKINKHENVSNLLLLMFKDSTSVICTRETQFVMSDGTRKAAQDLKYDDSLCARSCTGFLEVKSFAFYYKPLSVYTVETHNNAPVSIELYNHIFACIGQ